MTLNPDDNVWQASLAGEISNWATPEVTSRAYCGAFQLQGGRQQKKSRPAVQVVNATGVHMGASASKKAATYWLLDEPTNDLDVETLPCAHRKTRWSTSAAERPCHARARPLLLDDMYAHPCIRRRRNNVELVRRWLL